MTAFFLFLCAIAITAVPLLTASRFGQIRMVSPLHIIGGTAFFGVFLKTIGYLFAPDRSAFHTLSPEPADPTLGYIYMMGFVLCLCAGYVLAAGRRLPPKVSPAQLRAHSARLGDLQVLLVLGAAAAVFLIVATIFLSLRQGGVSLGAALSLETLYQLNTSKLERLDNAEYGASFAYVTVFFSLISFAFIIVAMQMFVRKRSIFVLGAAGAMAIMLALSALFRGTRADLLEIVALGAIIYLCYKPRINVRLVLTGAAVIIPVIGLFVVMTQLRLNKEGVEALDFTAIQPIIDQILFSTYFFDANVTALIVEFMPRDEYYYGRTYLDWIIGLIPRAIWEDKPAISLGLYTKAVILERPGTIGGINPTQSGEAFINFGWFGILVGLIFGAAFRKVETLLLSERMLRFTGGPWVYAFVIFGLTWSLIQTSFSIFLVLFLVELFMIGAVITGLKILAPRTDGRRRKRKRRIQHIVRTQAYPRFSRP